MLSNQPIVQVAVKLNRRTGKIGVCIERGDYGNSEYINDTQSKQTYTKMTLVQAYKLARMAHLPIQRHAVGRIHHTIFFSNP